MILQFSYNDSYAGDMQTYHCISALMRAQQNCQNYVTRVKAKQRGVKYLFRKVSTVDINQCLLAGGTGRGNAGRPSSAPQGRPTPYHNAEARQNHGQVTGGVGKVPHHLAILLGR
jgi:hypothetical protein